uniref:Uncharacterized protein n=1 Tax=Mesocestoides corti TaxID=53468 RepID=A0A5K3FUV1_MESCO
MDLVALQNTIGSPSSTTAFATLLDWHDKPAIPFAMGQSPTSSCFISTVWDREPKGEKTSPEPGSEYTTGNASVVNRVDSRSLALSPHSPAYCPLFTASPLIICGSVCSPTAVHVPHAGALDTSKHRHPEGPAPLKIPQILLNQLEST